MLHGPLLPAKQGGGGKGLPVPLCLALFHWEQEATHENMNK